MTSQCTVLAKGLNFPEGPAFDTQARLWLVEVRGGSLVRWSDGGVERHSTGGVPNGLAFDRAGRAWLCDQRGLVRHFDPMIGDWQTMANTIDGQPLNKPNDLAFDGLGNLVFTCPGNSRTDPSGYVCCLKLDGSVKKIAETMYFPNGLAFLDGGHTLVVAETYRQRLWKGEWDAEASRWVNAQPWADVGGRPGPDGMALGKNGLLYVAVFGSGQIKGVDAHGQIVEAYKLPGMNPTNVAFDPSGQLGLVVTEAERGLLLSMPQLGPGVRLFDGGDAWQ